MKSILGLFIVLISFSVNAQYDVNQGEQTDTIISIEGKDYPVLKTTNGSPFIVCKSPKSGNNYPVWIGNETDKKAQGYEGKPVRVSKKGKYFIFLISKNGGNPYCKYLQDDLII